MNFQWLSYKVKQALNRKIGLNHKKSYSQCGEDLIIRTIFDSLKIATPSYLDVGAHHPTYLNNTQLFYETGCHGVNVEPDPTLIGEFEKQRPNDVNLNIGIACSDGFLPFYVMTPRTLNTFSQQDAEHAVAEGSGKVRLDKVIDIPVRNINDLISCNFADAPDFLSLDVEGMDLVILQSLDFSKFRPKVICIESITYSEKRRGKKITEIGEWIDKQGYFLYADTYINSIFVDNKIW